MKINIITLFFLFFALFPYQGQASVKSQSQIGQTEIHSSERLDRNENTTPFPLGRRNGKTNNQITFVTRTGFVLLRKEEIISLSVNKLYGGIMLQYWRMGEVKSIHCQSTITKAMERLSEFPFVKVSRSHIVSMDEVEEYIGTKRNAHLVMRNESMVKISRNRAGEIYDWFSGDSFV